MSNNQNSNEEGKVICEKFRLIRRIGKGSFGEVYYAMNTISHREIAIKMSSAEDLSSQYQINFESKVYRVLSDGKHVPFARLHMSPKGQKFLVMDLLGPDLESVFEFCNRHFSLLTICLLAEQMISAIEHVHNNSMIHCDIKPENFLLGMYTNYDRVYLVDFGLSKQYAYGMGTGHCKYSNSRSLVGTARYVSINAHVGIALARRDDLESIGYLFVYFAKGRLPWQNLPNCGSRKQKYDRICEVKLSTTLDDLTSGLPTEFREYIEYCRMLRFDQKPDYHYLKVLFRKLLKDRLVMPDRSLNAGIMNSGLYDAPAGVMGGLAMNGGELYFDWISRNMLDYVSAAANEIVSNSQINSNVSGQSQAGGQGTFLCPHFVNSFVTVGHMAKLMDKVWQPEELRELGNKTAYGFVSNSNRVTYMPLPVTSARMKTSFLLKLYYQSILSTHKSRKNFNDVLTDGGRSDKGAHKY